MRGRRKTLLVLAQGVDARKGHLFRLVLRAFFPILFFLFLSFFLFYYRLINKRFPGGPTSGTWRRRVIPISRVCYFDRIFFRCSPRFPCPSSDGSHRVRVRALLFKVRSGERRFDVLPPVMSPRDLFSSGDGHCLNTQWLCIYYVHMDKKVDAQIYILYTVGRVVSVHICARRVCAVSARDGGERK